MDGRTTRANGHIARALCLLIVPIALALAGAQRPPSRPSGKAPTPARDSAVPFRPGEVLEYDVTWSGLLTAGTTTVTVHDRRASYGASAYYVTAEGRPSSLMSALYPIYYKADSLIDTVTLLPQRGSLYSDEKGRRHFRVTRFDQAARTMHYELQDGDPAQVTNRPDQPVPPRAHDALSVVFFLRTLPLSAGATQVLPVVVNGRVYRVQTTVTSRERVRCGLGDVDAWRVTPTLVDERDREDGRNFSLWLSDDARRLPLKLQGDLPVGAFTLTLTSAR